MAKKSSATTKPRKSSAGPRAKAAAQAKPPQDDTQRRVRADAQRNLDALLDAAKTVFATAGVEAPVRDIAERAGVGIGTLYRHFPQRADLIVAVVRHEIDACADAAASLAASHAPGEALARWMQRFVDFLGTKRGLAGALHSGDPAYAALPDYFEQRLLPALRALLAAGAASGDVRPGLDAHDVLHAVARLASPQHGDDRARVTRMVGLLVDGMRFGAASPAKRRPR